MRGQDRWKQQARYWKTLPAAATVLFFAAVFCLFNALGLVFGIMNAVQTPMGRAVGVGLISAGCAIGWAFAGTRRLIPLMIVMFPVQFGAQWLFGRLSGPTPGLTNSAADHAELLHRVHVEGALAVVMIIAGYTLMVAFIRKEGLRMFGPMTEMRLASELHQALVPVFSRKLGEYEIYGTSVPSGQVGGDLVDLTQGNGHWMAYVADVSGHGVPAGMIMAMVKSAARMGSSGETSTAGFLSSLNRVLMALSARNVFVTFACISGGAEPDLTFALAGHLPVLHYRKRLGSVEERSVSNLPLAVVPDAEFVTAGVRCEPGDILAIVTDGFTEIADKRGHELGLEPLKAALAQSAGASMEGVAQALRSVSLRHGAQIDDQTVLLVRRDANQSSTLALS